MASRIDINSKVKALKGFEDLRDIIDTASHTKIVIIDCHQEWVS